MNWDWFVTRLRPGMVVYDIGANRGQMAMLFAHAVGPSGCVASFEPVPAVFEDLTRNLNLNRLNQVKPMCAAVSDRAGTASFHFSEQASLMGKLAECNPSKSVGEAPLIQVKTVRLDDLADKDLPPPHFLKIDVEGAADKVLAGAERVLSEYRPEIYIELHGPPEEQAVRDLIQNKQYTARTITGKIVTEPITPEPLWCLPSESTSVS